MQKNKKTKRFGFPKNEHLAGKKAIENLFENGKNVIDFPLRTFFEQQTNIIRQKFSFPCQKSTSKEPFGATYHKRLIRENYRLNKQIINDFLVNKNYGISIAITLITSEKQNFLKISEKIVVILNKILVNLQ